MSDSQREFRAITGLDYNYFESPEYLNFKFLHEALLDEIYKSQGNPRRLNQLWGCYDIMFSPPSLAWDLEWRRLHGYNKHN